MYIGFPAGMDGGGGRPSHQLEICSFPPPGKIPLVDPLPRNFYPLPSPTICPSSPLNNNSHVITQWKRFKITHQVPTALLKNSPFYPNIRFTYPSRGIPTSHFLALFGKPWYIKWSSLVHWYQQWVTVSHLPKCMSCHKAILIINRMAHCFHEYT